MRPTLKRLAEQQIHIETLALGLDTIAKAAGIDLSGVKATGAKRLDTFARQASSIPDGSVKAEDTAAFRAVASTRKLADVENPANPIPEPSADSAEITTEEAKTPEATEDVQKPMGEVATSDVPPDANTSVTEPGVVLDEPLDLNEVDVTAPVQGTQSNDGANKVDYEIQGDPADAHIDTEMFPKTGPFTEEQKVTGNRTFASLRLARLQMQAGIEPQQEDIVLAQAIASNPKVTDEAIAAETDTLTRTLAAQASRAAQQAPPAHLVPKSASAQRGIPSMVASNQPVAGEPASMAVSDDEALW